MNGFLVHLQMDIFGKKTFILVLKNVRLFKSDWFVHKTTTTTTTTTANISILIPRISSEIKTFHARAVVWLSW